MTSRILLARHGNTFHAGEKAVFVGSGNDLSLTPRGREQAKETGLLLVRSKIIPSRIISGPLRRTKEFAEIAANEIPGAPLVQIDSRLNELEYGKWAGLSNEEIADKFGPAELEAWNDRSIWPKNAGWPESEHTVVSEVLNFIAEAKSAANPLIFVVSSSGRLRYFPKFIPGTFEALQAKKELKVQTGHIGLLNLEGSSAGISFWNRDPKLIETI